MTNASETLLQECAQTFKMIKELSGNQKIKHESFLMLEKIGDHLVHSIRAVPPSPVVDVEMIADIVLKAAGSGGLKHYMPYTKDKIIADLTTYFEVKECIE